MKGLLLFGLLGAVAAETVPPVPPWLYGAGTLVASGVLIRYYMARVEKRVQAGIASKSEAETEQIIVGAATAAAEGAREQLASYRDEVLAARESAAQAMAKLATAQAQLAHAQAAQAGLEAQASRERHDLRERLAISTAEVGLLKKRVDELQAEVETLQARLGQRERRQDGDRRDPDEGGPSASGG